MATEHFDSAVALNHEGEQLFFEGAFAAAQAAFLRAIELAPDFADAHNNLGVMYDASGETVLAMTAFAAALDAAPGHQAATLNYATLLHHQGRVAEAREACERFLEATGDDPEIRELLKSMGGQVARRCVFINTFYNAFLDAHYRANPGLVLASYAEQKSSLEATCFGDSDFYSLGMRKAGWYAEDLIINCAPLQGAWAAENGLADEGLALVIAQVQALQPDVIYLQDLSLATPNFLAALRPHTTLIVGQIASPLPAQADIHGLDIIFSSFPHFVDRFRQAGITSYYQPLAFDARVLDRIGPQPKQHPVTFVGGISAAHGKGLRFLEELSRQIPVDFWGYGAPSLEADSPIRPRHHGEAWGLTMFSLLAQSGITINRHIDVAENHANNMRLFEATGCGALLITDYKDNLDDLFTIGEEVVAYRSPEECAALVKYYLANPEEAQRIARAGQARTLRDHSYTRRMEHTAEVLARHLRYLEEFDRFPAPDMARISYGKTVIPETAVTEPMTTAWQSPSIPAKQRALTQQELTRLYAGQTPMVYQVLADSLQSLLRPGDSLLEIGCSSGYYYEILEYLLKQRITYTGVDYSETFIEMARDYYPNTPFQVADGAKLPFADRHFSVAISSCVLLHVPNYVDHIQETARVADRYIVAHRTPVSHDAATQRFRKYAYEMETVELRFNEQELLDCFATEGFQLIQTHEYYAEPALDSYEATYVFKRIR